MSEPPLARVWLLAAGLSGHAPTAELVARRVAATCRGLHEIDPVRLDRLAVLWTREQTSEPSGGSPPLPEGAVPPGWTNPPAPVHALLAALSGQPREAWILARVFGFDLVRVARSMDCSRTAAQRYLEQALALTAATGLSSDTAMRSWLDALPSISRAASIEEGARRTRRRRKTTRNLIGGFISLLLLWALLASLGR